MNLNLIFILFLIEIISGQQHDIWRERVPSKTFRPSVKYALGDTNPPIRELTKNVKERTTEFWVNMAQKDLSKRILRVPNMNKAKNVILFIGDGMSIPTLTASRTFKGQKEGKTGEEESLFFENFPYTGLLKTYCANGQIADSACTATAYLCGVKSNIQTIGMNARVLAGNCLEGDDPANHVDSILQWAQNAKKSTGLVTSTTVTHASPSASYAHSVHRLFESDARINSSDVETKGCKYIKDIAKQLITDSPGKDFNVILGGGQIHFQPSEKDGIRLDGLDLIEQWKRDNPNGRFVTKRSELNTINPGFTEKIFGLFGPSHLKFNMLADPEQPSLAEMTEAAIRILRKEEEGYLLFVEGGRIDHAHHATKVQLALDETVELAKAVEIARNMTSEQDTLIVVTSDHAHTMSISGYSNRGNDIFGFATVPSTSDNLPYTTLSYANGPQQYLDGKGSRMNLRKWLSQFSDYPSYVPMEQETHGGDDVAVFASGPQSHLFTGLYEQHFLPHIMAYASCIGSGKTMCN